MSELKRIGQNGVNEFFEDLTYSVAYNEILTRINKFIDMDNEMVKSAVESSLTVMVSSALFLYIQKQEQVLLKVSNIVFGVLASLFSILGASVFSKFKKFKGRKLKNIMNFFSDSRSDIINSARLSVEVGSYYSSKNSNSNSSSALVMPSVLKQGQLIQSETHKLNYARAKVQSINETLLFKLFTSKFTPKDKEFIRRMCGGAGDVDIDKLNKVAEFMYVTDDSGEITGLSEQFLTMLNGLGYYKGKEKGKNSGK